jgi:hypothetical protein
MAIGLVQEGCGIRELQALVLSVVSKGRAVLYGRHGTLWSRCRAANWSALFQVRAGKIKQKYMYTRIREGNNMVEGVMVGARLHELFVCTVWSFDTRGLFLFSFLCGVLSLFYSVGILMFTVYAVMHLVFPLSISYPS